MRILLYLASAGVMATLLPHPASGQGLGLGASVHVGTLGLGGRVSLSIGDQLNLRGGVDLQPFEIQVDLSDVRYDLRLPSPSLTALVDWHPGGGGFRASGGVVSFSNALELEATPTSRVEIGEREYDPAQIGSLIGSMGTSKSGPYLGIGWGNAAARRLALSLDLGVVFHGPPDVALRATGPVADTSPFLADLDAEIEAVNEDIALARVYPVLNLGLSVGL